VKTRPQFFTCISLEEEREDKERVKIEEEDDYERDAGENGEWQTVVMDIKKISSISNGDYLVCSCMWLNTFCK